QIFCMKPILLDFDGVLAIGTSYARDLQGFFDFTSSHDVPVLILSNSTLRTGKDIRFMLQSAGVKNIPPSITTIDAAMYFLRRKNLKVKIYCDTATRTNFKEFEDNESPDAVVVGDLGPHWTFEALNEIFRLVHSGVQLIALHHNKFWYPDGKTITLDVGAFIKGIEYSTGTTSTLIGKPSPVYFETALQSLGYAVDNGFIMIGDDLENDIVAAQKIGGTGILVGTGKERLPLPKAQAAIPNEIVQELIDVIPILEKKYL
ncbi:MAG: HAD hydrolase-like protein, partial [Ignavibacteria bacterium]|nr:HAD hydrolase-like protein [Ignavibacteria bacterium]